MVTTLKRAFECSPGFAAQTRAAMTADIQKSVQFPAFIAHDNHALISQLHHVIRARLRQTAHVTSVNPHTREDALLFARVNGGIIVVTTGESGKKRGCRLSSGTHTTSKPRMEHT